MEKIFQSISSTRLPTELEKCIVCQTNLAVLLKWVREQFNVGEKMSVIKVNQII